MYKINIVEYPHKGPTIVLLHGLGGTHRYWLTGLEQLKAHYHIVLVDLLGFGDSDKPWVNYTKERHLTALEGALQSIGPFVLVGHSLGAALALSYSVRNPQQVIGQVLIGLPFFQTEKIAYKWFRRTPGGWLLTNMLTTMLACIITRHIMARFLPFFFSEFPKEVVEDLLKHNFMSSTTTLWQVLYNSTIERDADHISSEVKTLCIHSVDDDTAPYGAVASLMEREQHWALKTLHGGAHHPWLWNNQNCVDATRCAIQCWHQLHDT